MAANHVALGDEIVSVLQANPAVTWFARLPPEAQEELLAVRSRFQSGGYAARRHQVATALVSIAGKRGWNLPTESTVSKWLKRK
jgi:hypothetical protein